jgi:hypothetical protein
MLLKFSRHHRQLLWHSCVAGQYVIEPKRSVLPRQRYMPRQFGAETLPHTHAVAAVCVTWAILLLY